MGRHATECLGMQYTTQVFLIWHMRVRECDRTPFPSRPEPPSFFQTNLKVCLMSPQN